MKIAAYQRPKNSKNVYFRQPDNRNKRMTQLLKTSILDNRQQKKRMTKLLKTSILDNLTTEINT